MRGNKLFRFLDSILGTLLLVLVSLLRRRRRWEGMKQPERILVVKLVALGDAVLLVPALRALRERFPAATITLVGTTLTHEFLRSFPEYVNQFILLDIGRLIRDPRYLVSLLGEIRKMRSDVAIDFEQWVRLTPILLTLSGIPLLSGFRSAGQHRHYAFDKVVDRNAAVHETENFLSLVSEITQRPADPSLEIKISQHHLNEVSARLPELNSRVKVVVLHPGCGSHGFPREWSPQKYRVLAREVSRDTDVKVLVTGVRQELGVIEKVLEGDESGGSAFIIEQLESFVALLSRADLFISGNTGAMHLAAALRRPQIALHGPTNSVQWGPRNPNAVIIRSRCPGCPCLDLGAEYHRTDGYCMDQISVQEVLGSARSLLDKAAVRT